MSQAVSSHAHVRVSKSLFGTKVVYTPTGSKIKVFKSNYDADALPKLRRIISAESSQALAAAYQAFNAQKKEIGNVCLDACVADDGNFVALQVLQFVNYDYRAVSDVVFFELDNAQLVKGIL